MESYNELTVIDLVSGKENHNQEILQAGGELFLVSFLEDGEYLLLNLDNGVQIFDINDGSETFRLGAFDVRTIPGSNQLIVQDGMEPNLFHILQDLKEVAKFRVPNEILDYMISDDGQLVVSTTEKDIQFWDLETQTLNYLLTTPKNATRVFFDSGSEKLAYAYPGVEIDTVVVVDINSKEQHIIQGEWIYMNTNTDILDGFGQSRLSIIQLEGESFSLLQSWEYDLLLQRRSVWC